MWRRDGNSSSRNTKHDLRSRFNISDLDWARFDPLFLRVLRARSITDCTDRTCVTCDQRNVHLSKPIVVRFWPGMQRTGLNLIRIMLVVNVCVAPLEHRLSIVFPFFIYRFDRKNGGFSNSFFFLHELYLENIVVSLIYRLRNEFKIKRNNKLRIFSYLVQRIYSFLLSLLKHCSKVSVKSD